MNENLELAKSTPFGDYYYQILPDTDSQNPREYFDNFGTMICFHRNYHLGDYKEAKNYNDPEHFIEQLSGVDTSNEWYQRFYDNNDQTTINTYHMRHVHKHNVILPLYLYDHSGISISTGSFNDPWDSGQVGWIYASHEAIKKEYGWKTLTKKRLAKVVERLKGEVSTYDDFLTGNVYGYKIYEPVPGDFDPDETDIEDISEELDSCWGFFGDPDGYILQEVMSSIASDIRHRQKKHFAQLKEWIKNKVELMYRKPFSLQ